MPFKISHFVAGYLLIMPAGMTARKALADSSDSQVDNPDKKYYWQDKQLGNLSRLSNSSPNFEDEQRRSHLGKDKEEYLSTIRSQMARQAAAAAKEKSALQFAGQLPTNPLEITETPTGTQVTLHMEMLFDDNTSSLRNGTADILGRLRALLGRDSRNSIHLMITDRMDDGPRAAQVDAERSLVVAAALQFSDNNDLFIHPN